MGAGARCGSHPPTTRIGTPGAPPAGESVDLPLEALPPERPLGALPDPEDRGDCRRACPLGGLELAPPLEPAHQVAVEGSAIGVYGASGAPRRERPRRARPSSPATSRKILLYRELSYWRAWPDFPPAAGLGLGNPPLEEVISRNCGRGSPDASPVATRVGLFEGLLHPHAGVEGTSTSPPGARAGREATPREGT